MSELSKIIVEKWELIAAIVVVVSGTGISGLVIWFKNRQKRIRLGKLPSGDFPFEVILPQSNTVLQQIMPSNDVSDPLADCNIPYQQRQPDRQVRQELEQAFVEESWVLILGRTGLGKTRESAHLAELLNREGWTILNLVDGEWLDVPRQFPQDKINPGGKLLFFLDDLNRWMYRGNPREIPDNADDPAQPLRVPVQERLLRTLEFYEQECRGSVRVIATARNEPQELEKLQFEKYGSLWRRFCCYELAEPSDEAIVDLLSDRVTAAQLKGSSEDYPKIARKNDKTFRNIVENLRIAKNRDLTVDEEQLSASLDQTWRKCYSDAVKKYPTARYVYDAIELLRRLNLLLSIPMVEGTAKLLIQKRGFGWLWQWLSIKKVIGHLQQTEEILRPRDGQIEAKKTQNVVLDLYLPGVLKLLAQMKSQYSAELLAAEFFDCGNALYRLGRNEEAIASFDQALAFKPDLHEAWYNRGGSLSDLGRYEDAIASYEQALAFKPELHEAWYNRGNSLSALGRNEEAIASYDQALAFKPDKHEAWYNRGLSLSALGRKEEAIASYSTFHFYGVQ